MDKNTAFQEIRSWNIRGKLFSFNRPRVMGILNLTPDSFYDGGRHQLKDQALKQAEQMLNEGADLLDLGAYSSRPSSVNISADEELSRLMPVLEAVLQHFPEALVSVDTFRARVAEAALDAGAHVINDISAGELDAEMFSLIANRQVPYVLMHMRGTPQTMKNYTQYDELLAEILDYFSEKLMRLRTMGVYDVAIDPGFGFAKNTEQNYEILRKLGALKILGVPVLAGLSRKSMIYQKTGGTAQDALFGTIAANTLALAGGASLLRVHDVKAALDAIAVFEAFSGS